MWDVAFDIDIPAGVAARDLWDDKVTGRALAGSESRDSAGEKWRT